MLSPEAGRIEGLGIHGVREVIDEVACQRRVDGNVTGTWPGSCRLMMLNSPQEETPDT
jgi:hypothetical protein